MSEPKPKPQGRGTLVVVFATILIDFIGFSVLVPVLPLWAEARLGATSSEVGMIVGLYALSMLLFLPMWGWISDRIGRRPVLLISLLGTAVSFQLLAYAETIAWVYFVRALGGFFAASLGTAQAVVTDITEAHERASGMGVIGAAFGMGMIVGPMLGGVLADIDPLAPFYGMAILAGASFVLALVALPETRPTDLTRPPWSDLGRSLVPSPLRIFIQLHDPRVVFYLVLFFLVFASVSVLEAMGAIFMARRFDGGVLDVAIFFAWVGVFLVVTQGVLIRRLVMLAGEVRLLIAGLALMAAGIAAVAVVPSYPAFFAVGAVIAIGQGLAFPPFTSLYTKVCRAEEAGEALGQSTSMSTAGRVVGAGVGGWLMETSTGLPFLASGAVMAFALLLFLAFRNQVLRGI